MHSSASHAHSACMSTARRLIVGLVPVDSDPDAGAEGGTCGTPTCSGAGGSSLLGGYGGGVASAGGNSSAGRTSNNGSAATEAGCDCGLAGSSGRRGLGVVALALAWF